MRKECVYEEEHERIMRLQGTVAKLEQKLKKLLASPEVAAASDSTADDGTDPKGEDFSLDYALNEEKAVYSIYSMTRLLVTPLTAYSLAQVKKNRPR